MGGGESKPAGGANLGGVGDRAEGRAAIHGGLAKLERWAEEPCEHQAELCQQTEGGDPSPLLITGGAPLERWVQSGAPEAQKDVEILD